MQLPRSKEIFFDIIRFTSQFNTKIHLFVYMEISFVKIIILFLKLQVNYHLFFPLFMFCCAFYIFILFFSKILYFFINHKKNCIFKIVSSFFIFYFFYLFKSKIIELLVKIAPLNSKVWSLLPSPSKFLF